ncbi:MAG: asparagine synthase (glutamine-hydrolyzing) [Alphaproteobacteria bacterium]|nr:asparagine synthase (glutamine-hydrolyzing) [Alphaproteobacteria bacterium]
MCGVFALFLNRPLNAADIRLGRQGTAALAHRGPDGSGEWLDSENGVFLGHRRLAIVDLSARSSQPMVAGNHVLSYNGEIYNFREEKRRLTARGHSFHSDGDVEVVLRGWQENGRKSLDRLDGMFAFALWDGEEAHLAVDVFGEKPLFLAKTLDGVWVSSEIGPLVEVLGLSPAFVGDARTAFLCLGNIPAPLTAFGEIERLPPATTITIRSGRVVSSERYWSIPVGHERVGRPEPVSEANLDEIAGILCQSVERRLIADVPLGLFLSSGIDSSLIAALIARELGCKVECLTVSFPKGNVPNEGAPAARIAEYLGLPHEIVENQDDPGIMDAAALIDLFGQPTENVSAFPVAQLARTASKLFKVAITGMGGDEAVFGYGKHAALYRHRFRYRLIGHLSSMLALMSVEFHETSRLAALLGLFGVRPWEIYLALKTYPALSWLRTTQGYEAWARNEFDEVNDPPYLWVPRYEQRKTLPNEHLIMNDVASMRASLELRTPFLNRELFEAVARFDPRSLVAFGQKSVLRRLLSRYLPSELYDLPKRGFRFPQESFLSAHGDAMPLVPGLPSSAIERIWSRRNSGRGWERLAVRLVALEEFLGRYPPTEEKRCDA